MTLGRSRHRLAWMLAGMGLLAGTGPVLAQPAETPGNTASQLNPQDATGAFATTVSYVIHFFPLWSTATFSGFAALSGLQNLLSAPDRITPAFKLLLGPSSDTLYAASFLNLSTEPVILTIPPTGVSYSVVVVDPYEEVIQSGIPPLTPGVYGLTGPGYSGKLPDGVTPIPLPVNYPIMAIRIDTFSSACVDQTVAAATFRASLKMQTLSNYMKNPSGGATQIRPVILYSLSVKAIGDALITQTPILFLKQLQAAVNGPQTPPLSPDDQKLSARFDALFGDGTSQTDQFSAGARKAFALLVNEYMTHTDANNWIHYINQGDFNNHLLERAAGAEFAQVSNTTDTALYYNAFTDAKGQPLNGANLDGYVIKFQPQQIPEAKRFWSISVYTREVENVIRNPINKYHVANCTPGLRKNPDGSLSIYVTRTLPPGVPIANWLPIGTSPFTAWMRIYGPTPGENESYVPPALTLRR